jgi:hypothetical protein
VRCVQHQAPGQRTADHGLVARNLETGTLVQNLKRDCGLDPADLVFVITENEDEDWSVGYGKAQFCNGELDPVSSQPRK